MKLSIVFILTFLLLQTDSVYSEPKRGGLNSGKACNIALVTIAATAAPIALYLTGNHELAGSIAWGTAASGVYAVLRARDSQSFFRPLAAVLGFPISFLPFAFVKEGSNKVFGLDVADRASDR